MQVTERNAGGPRAWMIWAFIPVVNPLAWAQAAIQTRRPWPDLLYALFYALPIILGAALADDGSWPTWVAVLYFVTWIVGMAQAVLLRHQVGAAIVAARVSGRAQSP